MTFRGSSWDRTADILAGVTPPPAASIVIPTYNRLDALERVLDALARQPAVRTGRAEVVVVDDGSDDGTAGWLGRRARELRTLEVLRQDNAGPARARNRGASAARGEIVLFLGDDTIPAPGWLEEHLEEHRLFGAAGPLAVVGYTSFPPWASGPFARYVNEHGAQFGYLLIERPTDVPFNFFYTSNVSLPRTFLLDLGGFREDFPAAAWEDIELAYRAVAEGLRLRYLPRARTIHEHRIRPRGFRRRQWTSGRSGAIFARLHPELRHFLGVHLARRPTPVGRLADLALLAAVEMGDRIPGLVPPAAIQKLLDRAYHAGLADGLGSTEEAGRARAET